MSVVAEQPITEREAEKRDCVMQIGRLGIEIGLLEGEAKGDSVIRAEMKALQSECVAAESRLHELLGAEREDRLAAEAEAVEAEARRQAHVARARELGAERRVAAKVIDQAFRQAAIALSGYVRLCQEQATQLTAAGNRPAADVARPRANRVNCALMHALRQASVPVSAIEIPLMAAQHVKPLVEGDPVAIEPEAA